MSDPWQMIGAVASVGTLLAALIGVPIALLGIRRARRERKTEFLSLYLKEYRSQDFGNAIKALWDFYDDCGGDQERMIEAYVKRFRRDHGKFHMAVRRRVSAYFQEMGFLLHEDSELRDTVFSVWNRGDLRVISNILLPLELRAVPRVVPNAKGPRVGERVLMQSGRVVVSSAWAPSHQVMADLYNEAVDRERRQFKHR